MGLGRHTGLGAQLCGSVRRPVHMIHHSQLTNDSELNDADLALVQGGTHALSNVIDPTPGSDEETIRKLHEQLNAAGKRGV